MFENDVLIVALFDKTPKRILLEDLYLFVENSSDAEWEMDFLHLNDSDDKYFDG